MMIFEKSIFKLYVVFENSNTFRNIYGLLKLKLKKENILSKHIGKMNIKYSTGIIVIYSICLILIAEGSYSMSCEVVDERYECSIPIEINIDDSDNSWEIYLKELDVEVREGEVNIELIISNNQQTVLNLEYYTYAYKGNKCISCKNTRNESIKQLEIKAQQTIVEEINLKGIFVEGTLFKVKYREVGKKTWKEIKGTILINNQIVIREDKFIKEAINNTTNEIINSLNLRDNKEVQDTLNLNKIEKNIVMESKTDIIKKITNIVIISLIIIISTIQILNHKRQQHKES